MGFPDRRLAVLALSLLGALILGFGLPPSNAADEIHLPRTQASAFGLLVGSTGEQAALRSQPDGVAGLGGAIARSKLLRQKATDGLRAAAGTSRHRLLGLEASQEPTLLLGSQPARLRAPPSS
jgi:hypothetical protein